MAQNEPTGLFPLTLPAVFADGMVLQRDRPIPVWGWASPMASVTVTLAGHSVQTPSDRFGAWHVELPALPVGGPHTLAVSAGPEALRVDNILTGDVWFCSGQSNMDFSLRQTDQAAAAIAAADFPGIREFKVECRVSPIPQEDCRGIWRICTPAQAGHFSGVGYYFARELHRELNVPVGLLNSSWGGTVIWPWIPHFGWATVPETMDKAVKGAAAEAQAREGMRTCLPEVRAWLERAEAMKAAGRSIPALTGLPSAASDMDSHIYNAMVAPLVKFPIRGALWYQGESNVDGATRYAYHMKAIINGWRQAWNQPDLPFFHVMLPPYEYAFSPTTLPGFWEAQASALDLPHTGMAVATDQGDPKDIHPPRKREVGRRLALLALNRACGRPDIVCSGPIYRALQLEAGRLRLHSTFSARACARAMAGRSAISKWPAPTACSAPPGPISRETASSCRARTFPAPPRHDSAGITPPAPICSTRKACRPGPSGPVPRKTRAPAITAGSNYDAATTFSHSVP